MQVKIERPGKTEASLIIIASADELSAVKKVVLASLGQNTKVPGFRPGKVPSDVLEKHLDQNQLQSRFLDEALQQLYFQALDTKKLRVVDNPKITIIKFVPYSTLEFKADVSIVDVIKIADYKKIKLAKPEVKVTAADVADVLKSLQSRLADKKDVDRPAKIGDQVWIDFKGVDAKGNDVKGAEGKDYPLALGSNTFIPGFEDNLKGLKAGQDKTFTLTFPKDYGVKALANRKVTFTVNVIKVQEVTLPKLDDDFAPKAGPFKTLSELKEDIKKQLLHERRHQIDRNYESELIAKISENSQLNVPEILINDQMERLLNDLKQNTAYRGQTYQEFLNSEGKTEEEYKEQVIKPRAHANTKASLVLAEIAEMEGLQVQSEEVSARLEMIKGQYKDELMRAELDKPEARRDIAARLLTEKTVDKLVKYASN